MKWLKYNHKWAWGDSKDFDYIRYNGKDDDESICEFIQDFELCKEHNWSDKYRGIDYELVDKPPVEWIKKEINDITRRIDGLVKYKTELELLL